jgi:hypothetical protein
VEARCDWCDHREANHGDAGCEVILCGCMLSPGDFAAYALAVALEELRQHWYA